VPCTDAEQPEDLTNIQLAFVLKTLRRPDAFLLCGDSNQVPVRS